MRRVSKRRISRSRKVYAREIFERQTNSIEAKETFGNGGGRNYANSQSFDQIGQMQSIGCRLRKIVRETRGESTDGLAVET